MDKVLIVDDDIAICKLLKKVVDSNELYSDIANSGTEALSLAMNTEYDVILMDINLGDMEGFDVIKKLRNSNILSPIIIISGTCEDYDALYGLSIGADDYVTKPFRPLIIGAKIKALIRRTKKQIVNNNHIIECGCFKYDTSTLRFYKNNKEITLTAKESNFILLFMKNPNKVFTKEMIYNHVWGHTIAVDDNTIMVYINRLRNKIEEDIQNPKYIVTVRGSGYRFLPNWNN